MRTLTTDRLSLHPFAEPEVDAFLSLCRLDRVHQYLWDGNPLVDLQARSLLAESDRTFDDHGFGLWSVFDLEKTYIGFTGLRIIAESRRIELLFGVTPDVWGKGFATEAVLAIVDHAFDILGLPSLEASSHPSNIRSLRLLERIGMASVRSEQTAVGPLHVFSIKRSSHRRSPRQ